MQCGVRYEIKNNHRVVEYCLYNEFCESIVLLFEYCAGKACKNRWTTAQPTAQPNHFWFLLCFSLDGKVPKYQEDMMLPPARQAQARHIFRPPADKTIVVKRLSKKSNMTGIDSLLGESKFFWLGVPIF